MWSREIEDRWQQEVEAVMTGMKEWRLQHPRATFHEIETALDEHLGRCGPGCSKTWRWPARRRGSAPSPRRTGPGGPRCGGRWRRGGSKSGP